MVYFNFYWSLPKQSTMGAGICAYYCLLNRKPVIWKGISSFSIVLFVFSIFLYFVDIFAIHLKLFTWYQNVSRHWNMLL